MSPNKLGRYDVIRLLGRGAMGVVYEARDPNLDRRVAIKTIRVENLSDDAAAEYEARFRTEARSAARLQHPNIVSVYDSDRDVDVAYLVMEFIQGEDLKHHLDSGTRYTVPQALGIMHDLLAALTYAHRQNIVHRDVKPANLLIEPSGRVKLTDFGIARIQDSGEATRTQGGAIVGTPKYMSPEQVLGQPVDVRTDVFSAGIVCYLLLTGEHPFDGDSQFVIGQQIILHMPPPPSSLKPSLPPAVDAVVAKAMAKRREERYATATEFATALQAAFAPTAGDGTLIARRREDTGGNSASGLANSSAGGFATIPANLTGTRSGIPVADVGYGSLSHESEVLYWKQIQDTDDPEDLTLFLEKFPAGLYADLARRRLRRLSTGGDSVFGLAPEATLRIERTVSAPHETVFEATQVVTAELAPVDLPVAVPSLAMASGLAAGSPAVPIPSATPAPTPTPAVPTVPPVIPVASITPKAPAPATSAPPVAPPRTARKPWFAIIGIALAAVAGVAYQWPSALGLEGLMASPGAAKTTASASPSATDSTALPGTPAVATSVPKAEVVVPPAAPRREVAATPEKVMPAGPQLSPGQVKGVTVRNAQLILAKELRSRSEISEFNRYWYSKQATNQTSAQVQDWSFTVDILSSGTTVERWQYQSNGLAVRVAAGVQKVYRIKNPGAFNLLIGAPRY